MFPNTNALVRLAGAALIEQDDESAAAVRRYFSERSTALPITTNPEARGQVRTPDLMTA